MVKRKIFRVKGVLVNLPFDIGEIQLETVRISRGAAWALYVEMTTRVATQQLEEGHGLLREALDSLYSLFATTRQILKEGGPDVGTSPQSVGGIAIQMLNQGLRPFLSKWHPQLKIWESYCPDGVSAKEHEQNWLQESQMRQELKALGQNLEQFTNELAKIAKA
ncbi:hypothetical protein C8255_21540 [filamentous cyanobacterium CCP3]|nr:hypothetical protein C8255_21540 [filamentous cyanobacterium CCP3]